MFYCQHQINDSHPILIDYGDAQFTLRIQDKGNTVTYPHLTIHPPSYLPKSSSTDRPHY